MVQLLSEAVWVFLTKPYTILSYYSAAVLLGIYQTDPKLYVSTAISIWMFTATLFLIAENGE